MVKKKEETGKLGGEFGMGIRGKEGETVGEGGGGVEGRRKGSYLLYSLLLLRFSFLISLVLQTSMSSFFVISFIVYIHPFNISFQIY